MSANSFFYPLVALSIAIVFGYLYQSTRKTVVPNSLGKYLLRVHKLYNIVGYISLVLSVIMIAGAFFSEDMDAIAYSFLAAAILLFGGLGLLSIQYYKHHQVVFDEEVIEVQNAFRVTRTMRWTEIHSGRFNPTTGLITFKDKTGNKIKLNQHLVGIGDFLLLLKKKTGLTEEAIGLKR